MPAHNAQTCVYKGKEYPSLTLMVLSFTASIITYLLHRQNLECKESIKGSKSS